MVKYVDKFMALNDKNKAAVTIGMLAGAAVVVYLLMKLIEMLRKESSFKNSPSKMPVMNRRLPVMEPSMARTHRRHHEEWRIPRFPWKQKRPWKPSTTSGSFNLMGRDGFRGPKGPKP